MKLPGVEFGLDQAPLGQCQEQWHPGAPLPLVGLSHQKADEPLRAFARQVARHIQGPRKGLFAQGVDHLLRARVLVIDQPTHQRLPGFV